MNISCSTRVAPSTRGARVGVGYLCILLFFAISSCKEKNRAIDKEPTPQYGMVDSPLIHKNSELFRAPEFYGYMGEENLKQLKDTNRTVFRLTISHPFDSVSVHIYKFESRVYDKDYTIFFASKKKYPKAFNPFLILGDPTGKSLETMPRVFNQENVMLSKSDWQYIESLLDSYNIWEKESRRCQSCYDVSFYQVEISNQGKYKYIELDSPSLNDSLGIFLKKISGLIEATEIIK